MAFLYREIRSSVVIREQQVITYPGHIHDSIELVYVQEGSATGVCDGKVYPLQSGDFFLIFPNQAHFYPEGTQGRYILLVVMPSTLPYHQNIFLSGFPSSAVYHSEDPQLEWLLLTAMEENRRSHENPAVFGFLTVFFEKLLPHYQFEKSRVPQSLMLNIFEYCAEHYLEDISINDICREFGVSRSHISHTFSKRINMSFPEYINSLRLHDAEKLLREQNYSITRVVNLSGFPTLRTFNRVFFKRYGVTPTQYRAAMRNK